MESTKAIKYPLLKDYEFGLVTGSGRMVILVPDNSEDSENYTPRQYGLGLIHLIPYLQTPFNNGESISISNLIQELKDENEFSLIPNELDMSLNREPFLMKSLKRFQRHNIVDVVKSFGNPDEINDLDSLRAGVNYETTRVYRDVMRE
tara:strand:- start:151 stop:594 length:444 start_codon:yes stop_codon:yes gene_type:complete